MKRREIRIVESVRPFSYPPPFPGDEHTLLVCAVDDSVTEEERSRMARQIVAAKCRYAVCWGHECSTWEVSIDCAYLDANNFELHDETFVMTTSHEQEPVEDAIDFWWMNTWFEEYESSRFVVLILGDDREFVAQVRKITEELVNHWNRVSE